MDKSPGIGLCCRCPKISPHRIPKGQALWPPEASPHRFPQLATIMTHITSEDDFLTLVDRHFPRQSAGVLVGRGDDAAVVAWPERVCVTTDLFLEDVHFSAGLTFAPGTSGYQAWPLNIKRTLAGHGRPGRSGWSLGACLARRAVALPSSGMDVLAGLVRPRRRAPAGSFGRRFGAGGQGRALPCHPVGPAPRRSVVSWTGRPAHTRRRSFFAGRAHRYWPEPVLFALGERTGRAAGTHAFRVAVGRPSGTPRAQLGGPGQGWRRPIPGVTACLGTFLDGRCARDPCPRRLLAPGTGRGKLGRSTGRERPSGRRPRLGQPEAAIALPVSWALRGRPWRGFPPCSAGFQRPDDWPYGSQDPYPRPGRSRQRGGPPPGASPQTAPPLTAQGLSDLFGLTGKAPTKTPLTPPRERSAMEFDGYGPLCERPLWCHSSTRANQRPASSPHPVSIKLIVP